MIISVTERGTFKRCRRRWAYSSRNTQNLEPVVNAPQLTLGWLVHKVLEEWTYGLEGFALPDEIDTRYMNLAAQKIEEIKLDYRERIGAPISLDELGPTLDQLELGRDMIQNYVSFHKQPLPDKFKLVQMEQTILVRIPGAFESTVCTQCKDEWPVIIAPTSCLHCGTPEYLKREYGYLEATLDGLVVDETTGKFYVLERKTFKSHPRQDTLTLNDQFTAYAWIVKQLGVGTPGGVLYDGLWKRSKPTKSRPKFEDLFFRHLIQVDTAQLDDFSRHIAEEYNDMLFCKAGISGVYPNRRWEGCWDCRFEMLCAAETRDEDVEYIREAYYKQRARDTRFDSEGEDDSDLDS